MLSLFFIDEVAKYRDYGREDTRGDYARVFEEEYAEQVNEMLGELDGDEAAVPRLPGGHPRREHSPGLLLHRQEDRPVHRR